MTRRSFEAARTTSDSIVRAGFPHFGHNANVAWGVTHAFVDIHDLYVERFARDGASYRFEPGD